MPRQPNKQQHGFSEKDLTKGQLRRLNALRRSLGDEQIAEQAFAKWLRKYGAAQGDAEDKTATMIWESRLRETSLRGGSATIKVADAGGSMHGNERDHDQGR